MSENKVNAFLNVPLTHLLVTVATTVLFNVAFISYFFGGQVQELKSLRMDISALQAAMLATNTRFNNIEEKFSGKLDTVSQTIQGALARQIATDTKLDVLLGHSYQQSIRDMEDRTRGRAR